jgi:aromatic-amino-acid transaminase
MLRFAHRPRTGATMNAPLAAPLLSTIEMAPRDPILGVSEAFHADPNPNKVNLGVGVYYDDNGKVPLLECVRHAEHTITERGRRPSATDDAARTRSEAFFTAEERSCTRAPSHRAGGRRTGAKDSADFCGASPPRRSGSALHAKKPRALFENAGFSVNVYPYYDAATRGLDFAGMIGALDRVPAGAIVVLHACCHNPTGVDPSPEQWGRILEVVRSRGHVPFLDLAYQGFGESLDADGAVVRRFAETPGPLFVSSSFSKSFSLYGERVGALSIVATDSDGAARVLSQVKRVVSGLQPADVPAGSVAAIARFAGAFSCGRRTGAMRERIKTILRGAGRPAGATRPGADFRFVLEQRGMFSYSPQPRAGRGCAASTRSTRSIRDASALRRSMRATHDYAAERDRCGDRVARDSAQARAAL